MDKRKPFQGVVNIIRFNWHFYLLATALILAGFLLVRYFDGFFKLVIQVVSFTSLFGITISLLISFYVYDVTNLYSFPWIEESNSKNIIVNINAGFDETSEIIKSKFPNSEFIVLDFYDPKKHTEISIERARKSYPPFLGTKSISTSNLEIEDALVDKIFLIFSAHEIRNELERIDFFKELSKVLKPTGEVYVTEHLRDRPNFLAYNIGFFHFYSKTVWRKVFKKSNFILRREIKYTHFISTFILVKNGNSF